MMRFTLEAYRVTSYQHLKELGLLMMKSAMTGFDR